MDTPTRPTVARQPSRVPGGFDTDDEISPVKSSYDNDYFESQAPPSQSPTPQVTQGKGNDSVLNAPSDGGRSPMAGEGDTFLQEREMRRKLEDVDSTLLPDISPATVSRSEDSFASTQPPPSCADITPDGHEPITGPPMREDIGEDDTPNSPATPPGMYQTPAPGREETHSRSTPESAIEHCHYNTSSLETMSSSPTAAAAARTVSRAVSMTSLDGGYETADDSKGGILLEDPDRDEGSDDQPTPRKSHASSTSYPRASSPTPKALGPQEDPEAPNHDGEHGGLSSMRPRKRPKFLNNRMASQRSSYSSYSTTSTEGGSDVTVGADFALQSGGAIPQTGSLSSRPTEFSRTISLGSIASGISDLSDSDDRIKPSDGTLRTVDEEDDTIRDQALRAGGDERANPQTPRSTSRNISTPTDTVIAQHVRDIEVPATMAREYGNKLKQSSPEKRTEVRNGKGLTLKEQSSTIDRLMKENWDLKLKINFLDDALSRRSDEGVKAMISENVDLRTSKFKSAKEMRELKRTNRELERKLKDMIDELAKKAEAPPLKDESGPSSEEFQFMENELSYFRERVMTYEVEVEKMRHESFAQEREKKRLAEVLNRASESNGGADIGVREEVVSFGTSRDLLILMLFCVEHVEGSSRCRNSSTRAGR